MLQGLQSQKREQDANRGQNASVETALSTDNFRVRQNEARAVGGMRHTCRIGYLLTRLPPFSLPGETAQQTDGFVGNNRSEFLPGADHGATDTPGLFCRHGTGAAQCGSRPGGPVAEGFPGGLAGVDNGILPVLTA